MPRNSRPNPILLRLKSLVLVITAGLAVISISVLSILASSTQVFDGTSDSTLRWLIRVATVLIIGLLLTLLFRVGRRAPARLAQRRCRARSRWRSSGSSLQALGAYYVTHVLAETSAMNQTFGLVLGLIGAALPRRRHGHARHRGQRRAGPAALAARADDAVHATTSTSPRPTGAPTRSTPGPSGTRAFEQVEVTFDDLPVVPGLFVVPDRPATPRSRAQPTSRARSRASTASSSPRPSAR